MIYYPISAFVNFVTSLVLAVFVILLNQKSTLNRSFFYFAFSVSIWSLCLFFWQLSGSDFQALRWSKILMFFASLIPSTFFHFCLVLVGEFKKNKHALAFYYTLSVFFGVVSLVSSLIVRDVRPRLGFDYWPTAGSLYLPFLFMFFSSIAVAHVLMIQSFYRLSGYRQMQIKYIFIGTLVGFVGGSTNYPLWYDIQIPPIGNILVSVYVILVAYAIMKYRLMDIRIVITRASVFLSVYALVLGIPFWMGYKEELWREATWIMLILATVGPFIYLHFQKKAEEQLLVEQRQYQATLRRASLGMGRLKDLKHLMKMIVHIVTRTVKIEHGSIYLLHRDSGQYILKASKGREVSPTEASVFGADAPLIRLLGKVRQPVLYEEIKQKSQDFNDIELKDVCRVIAQLGAELLVPCVIDSRMLAIVVLGKKRSGRMYSHDDLVVFSILANQSAMAIENAVFYESAQKTTQQLFQAEKMATIGTMADGLSHQINNRLHAMGFVAGDALDSIHKFKNRDELEGEVKILIDDVEHALGRIQDNVRRGGEIVGGLLRYTRKGAEGMGSVVLSELLDASLEMAQFKIRLNSFEFIRNFNGNVPLIRGNFAQLQEVFFNVIDNSYDAMMQRRADLGERFYQPRFEVNVDLEDQFVNIILRDNGIGVRPEDMGKMFTPFFTTKASAKKGTGLGMYVIRQIIEENHGGKVRFDSKYKAGSKTLITLPRA